MRTSITKSLRKSKLRSVALRESVKRRTIISK
jgi:hypothetical protein